MKLDFLNSKFLIVAVVFLTMFFGIDAKAAIIGDVVNFNVESKFDKNSRENIPSVLIQSSSKVNFYIEKIWWEDQVPLRKQEILQNLSTLGFEFDKNIYPHLTSVFGSEWIPGIDGDTKITVFLHQMQNGVGGYFRESDEYLKFQAPSSNEREMLYLPISQIDTGRLKIFLAHEFVHLVTFNQKNKINDAKEDIWLNEARAEYAISLLGYNSNYDGSSLAKRVDSFLQRPNDSLVEWRETKYDYGISTLFINYLADHYGLNILSDSLESKLVGIASINEALRKNGYQEDFSQVFSNFSVALVVGNCSIDIKHCFLNENLTNLKVPVPLIFLPAFSNSFVSFGRNKRE